MELKSVEVQQFRSAQDVSLNGLGPFNVLIGKNNAGKSTVLTGIDAFFRTLSDGDVISLDPPIGASVDYFDSDTTHSIRLGISFHLTEGELHELRTAIAAGTPQLEEAARSLTSGHCLHVIVEIVSGTPSFSFVRSVELKQKDETPRTLLEVSIESAEELREIKALQLQ